MPFWQNTFEVLLEMFFFISDDGLTVKTKTGVAYSSYMYVVRARMYASRTYACLAHKSIGTQGGEANSPRPVARCSAERANDAIH